MHSLFEGLANLVVHRPRLISEIFLLLMLVSLGGMSLITMATGNDTYLDKDSERGIISNHYADTFQQNTLVLLFECSDPTSPDLLAYIDSIMGPIRHLQYVSGTSSVADVMKEANNGTLPQSSGEITAIREKISPVIFERYVPSNLLNMAMVTLEPGLSETKERSAMDNIRSFIASTDIPPGV